MFSGLSADQHSLYVNHFYHIQCQLALNKYVGIKNKIIAMSTKLKELSALQKIGFLLFPHLMNFLGLPRLREWLYLLQMVEKSVQ